MVTASEFTHFDTAGNARMVDVSAKNDTLRQATAEGRVVVSAEVFEKLRSEGVSAKGDVLGVARIAGIMAAKKVDQLIPLCHSLPIAHAAIDFVLDPGSSSVKIMATVGMCGKTGVEMEALTAVSVAALTIYDMCKSMDKSMELSDIRLVRKSGGKSGDFVRNG